MNPYNRGLLRLLASSHTNLLIMPLRLCGLAILTSLLCSGVLANGAELLLPFQARLTDSQGRTLPDDTNVFRFQIFSEPSATAGVAWNGEIHRTTINGGLINVILGTQASLTNVDFGRTLYLEITPDTSGPGGKPDGMITELDTPILPRQLLIPVLFANRAKDSELFNGHPWEDVVSLQRKVDGLEARLAALERQVNDVGVSLEVRLTRVESKTRLFGDDGASIYYSDRQRMAFQPDGNVVIYRDGVSPVWQSNTPYK